MAIVRGCASLSQAVTTVWRVGRRIPRLNRFLSPLCYRDTPLSVGPENLINLGHHTKVEAFSSDSCYQELELTDDCQILNVLEEALEQSKGEETLVSRDTKLSTVCSHIRENSAIYSTETIIELLELLHDHEIKHEDMLVSLGEELSSRISSMSLHFQQKILHILQKLNLDQLKEAYGSLDTTSFASALKQNSESANNMAYLVQTFKGESWSTELSESLQDYVIASSSKLSLRGIYQILSVMIEKEIATPNVLRTFAKAVSCILTLDIPTEERWQVWGAYYPLSVYNLLWAFGKMNYYDEELYAAFASLIEGPPDSQLHTPRFLANLSWSCAKVRFYSESLMQSIAEHSLRELVDFTNQDIALLVYSFGILNCRHHELFNAAVDKILRDPNHLENSKLCWIIAWVAMVLEQYPERLLSQMLTDDYLKYSLGLPGFRFTALLQLCIALNVEQPELGFGFKFDPSLFKKWGRGFISAGNVSRNMMQQAMKNRISMYKYTSNSSPFDQNVARALKVALGGAHFYNAEALSIAGYNLDCEILFDANHRPIPIPIQWKYRKRDIVMSSVGIGRAKRKKRSSAELLETAKEVERENHNDLPIPIADTMIDVDPPPKEKAINLASDWGQKFILPSTRVSKKVAVEADGPWHFASNCNHILGPTVLKHRQLKALGWEVISIPYMEWDHLKAGSDQVEYLIRRFNLHTTNSW